MSAIRLVYRADWAPKRANVRRSDTNRQPPRTAPVAPGKNLMKASSSLSSFMMGSRARAEAIAEPVEPIEVNDEVDELEKYLAYPEADMDVDLQQWWVDHAPEFPTVAKMARQWLSSPASSAEVERVFSKAGKMHDDQRKRTSEDLLCENLMLGYNLKMRRLP